MYFNSNEYFTYDGHQSYLYGLRFAWIEESPETEMVSEKTYNHIKNAANNNFVVAKSEYEEPLEFKAEIISDRVLTNQEVRRIYNQFFDKNQFKELKLKTEYGENIYFNCIMTDIKKEEGGLGDRYGVIGFTVTIICDAPWGWTDEKKITFTASDMTEKDVNSVKYKEITINNLSDSQDYIYPEVEIVVYSKDAGRDTVTRIGSPYSCYGCAFYSKCRDSGDLPDSLDKDIADNTAYVDNTTLPKKAMIINTDDDENRGTCIIEKSNSQKIIMNPRTGSITGYDGNIDNGEYRNTDEKQTSRVSYTNKKFIRLLPGQNTFWLENVFSITFRFREARVLV